MGDSNAETHLENRRKSDKKYINKMKRKQMNKTTRGDKSWAKPNDFRQFHFNR